MQVSVVICTYNRAAGLLATLDSLLLQRYRSFEVVVVNGPSTDDTNDVLNSYAHPIRVVQNPHANLSSSRNIGIRAAAGDVVAFIDDDAIPEPGWLEQAIPGFADDEVAGVGGLVLDHTGMTLQYKYSASNRFGETSSSMERPFDEFCVPGSATFPYLQGTNALFRRDALASIGLFDETFDFYLDETDVCCRLVDKGYLLRQLPIAVVHHKYLPSARRNEARVVTNWLSVMRNHVYFGYRHGLLAASEFEVIVRANDFKSSILRDAEVHENNGNASSGHLERARQSCDAAVVEGMRIGREIADRSDTPVDLDSNEFLPFLPPRPGTKSLRIILVSSGYTPDITGGIARFISDVAPELQRRGHEVRVFCRTDGPATVDLERGVWVHRLRAVPTPGRVPEASPAIDSFASAVGNELERIALWWTPDVVYGSLWDVEMLGIARFHPTIPIVPMLATPLAEVAEHEGWLDASHQFNPVAVRIIQLEREMVARSAIVHAISQAIVATFNRLYPGALSHQNVVVAPIGRADDSDGDSRSIDVDPWRPIITFVGRLEPRKGIDVFLAAMRFVLADHDDVEVAVIGDHTRDGPLGVTYPAWWASLDDPGTDRLCFHGAISDSEMHALLARSTVVAMPSRYESFGLVAVEAMMHGRPVVASDVGGLAEIIDDGRTGFLVPVGDAGALAAAVDRLIRDPELANQIGANAREQFENRLSARAAAERLESVLASVVAATHGSKEEVGSS